MNKLLVALAFCSSALFVACETPDDNSIAMAQQCLDSATPATAVNCSNLVNGIDKPQAWGIKCASDFISDGITTTRITNAVANMTNQSFGATNSAATLMLYLSFSTAGVASNAMSDCTKSGSKGYQFFASAAQMGTTIATIAGGGILASVQNGTANGAAINTAINNAVASGCTGGAGGTCATIGTAAQSLYVTQCAVLTLQNTSACKTLTAAIGGSSDPATIGAAVITALKNPPPN